MGVFRHPLEIAATEEGPFENLRALVDTGSIYTWVPASLLTRLGLTPSEQQAFQLEDGTLIQKGLTEAVVRLLGRTRHTLVVFGDETGPVLLGAYTLEGFTLGVDPMQRRLVPMSPLPAAVSH